MTKDKTIGRRVSLLAAFLLFCTGIFAQVEFETGAPQMVEAGTSFRIEFTLTTHTPGDTPSGFTDPEFSGISIIAGPVPSSGENHVSINGKQTSSYIYTYTYVLSVPSAGRVWVPAASVTVGGKNYSTKPVQIEVVAAGASRQGQGQGTSQQQSAGASNAIQKDDVLVRIIPSRTTVYKGEPLRIQLKLYTRQNLVGVNDVKYPAFNGFWSQEIQVNDPVRQEEYNGKLYNSQVLREFLLFPQQSGSLSVEQFSLTVIARTVTQTRPQSLMEEFFGGGATYNDVPLKLTAGPLPVTVKDWPAGAPPSFTGAVGQFKLEGGPNQIDIAANSSANYDVKISGSGNLPLVTAPKIEMPTSFEQYTTTTSDDYRTGGTNISGSKTFSTPFIPRAEGEYAVPPVEFTYFDPSSARYVTLRTPNYSLRIGEDKGGWNASSGLVSGVNKEDLKILGEDIRFIRIASPKLHRIGALFLFSWKYWAVLLLMIGGFIAALVYLQQQIKLRNNKTLIRNRRAQKVALRRLKTAEKHMLAKDPAGFYDEMLKALWGYMSDKLNIPVSNLSRDNVKVGLASKGVDPELTDRYIAAIAECEYMQYAPSDKTQIGDVYNSAVELISKMESKI